MTKTPISMDYYPEGDMLSITFGPKGRKGKGYELSENIYIRVDPSTHEPLGLTILSYSKLLTLDEFSLSFWNEFDPEEQDIMRTILGNEPLNRFLNLKDITTPVPVSTFHNPSLQEIVAA
jgi:hypothetical protein